MDGLPLGPVARRRSADFIFATQLLGIGPRPTTVLIQKHIEGKDVDGFTDLDLTSALFQHNKTICPAEAGENI